MALSKPTLMMHNLHLTVLSYKQPVSSYTVHNCN